VVQLLSDVPQKDMVEFMLLVARVKLHLPEFLVHIDQALHPGISCPKRLDEAVFNFTSRLLIRLIHGFLGDAEGNAKLVHYALEFQRRNIAEKRRCIFRCGQKVEFFHHQE
jgi:hypothetical protein